MHRPLQSVQAAGQLAQAERAPQARSSQSEGKPVGRADEPHGAFVHPLNSSASTVHWALVAEVPAAMIPLPVKKFNGLDRRAACQGGPG